MLGCIWPIFQADYASILNVARSGSGGARSAGIGNNLHVKMPLARAVKFAKENALPPAQRELASLHKDHLARSSKRCLHVRVSVPFRVPVWTLSRHKPVENAFQIRRDIRVRMLIDGYARRCMRNVHIADAARHS